MLPSKSVQQPSISISSSLPSPMIVFLHQDNPQSGPVLEYGSEISWHPPCGMCSYFDNTDFPLLQFLTCQWITGPHRLSRSNWMRPSGLRPFLPWMDRPATRLHVLSPPQHEIWSSQMASQNNNNINNKIISICYTAVHFLPTSFLAKEDPRSEPYNSRR
jgi:hypothetical protein